MRRPRLTICPAVRKRICFRAVAVHPQIALASTASLWKATLVTSSWAAGDTKLTDSSNAARLYAGLCSFVLLQSAFAATPSEDTRTPIKHLVVIIGENRTFDHVFATYRPAPGERVWNLLSQGIVTDDGAPGPNFAQAEQQTAPDPSTDAFLLGAAKKPFPDHRLPPPLVGGPRESYIAGNSLQLAKESENGLPDDYYR
jgi:hypothetical protein